MTSFASILMAAIGIGFLIFIHELGHYICARLAGVRVEVFSLGFGQRIAGFVWRGTDYRLSLVPFGGYVRVAGEDPTQRQFLNEDDLYAKGFGARFLFFSGGVVMNLLFALVAFPIVFNNGVQFTAPMIGSVTRGSAAWEADLRKGDRVLRIDGKEMYSFENMRVEIALGGDSTLEFEIDRDGEHLTVPVRPRYDENDGLFAIGVRPSVEPIPPLVTSVDRKSPAAEAGLQSGDRVVAINDLSAVGAASVEAFRSVADTDDQPITLIVDREGQAETVTFVPAKARDKQPRIGVLPASRTVSAIRPNIAPLARLGLQHGDRVLAVDGHPFAGDGLDFVSKDIGPEITFSVRRDGRILERKTAVTAEDREAIVANLALGPDLDGVALLPVDGSPAAHAGLKAGDEILTANDEEISEWTDLIGVVRDAEDRPLRLEIRRLGSDSSELVTVTPTRRPIVDLGFTRRIDFMTHEYRVESFGGSLEAGFVASIDLIKQLYVTLKRLITGDVAAKNLGGIVQISRASYHYAEKGWAVFLYFLALLSINLAFINVLPIPVLDGGHLLFLVIEKVKGSPVSTKVLTYSQILGLVFVIALMLFVTYNDILKLL